MTAKRDLKRRVRERQLHTGESYMTALRQVRSHRPGAVPVIEMIDITEVAAALGIQCGARLSPTLADRIDVAGVLYQLRAALTATARDPAFDLMRAVLLRGEHRTTRITTGDASRRFMARVRAGIGGISEHGHLLALAVPGRRGVERGVERGIERGVERGIERSIERGIEMVLFALRLAPVQFTQLPPLLFVGSTDGALLGLGGLALELR